MGEGEKEVTKCFVWQPLVASAAVAELNVTDAVSHSRVLRHFYALNFCTHVSRRRYEETSFLQLL